MRLLARRDLSTWQDRMNRILRESLNPETDRKDKRACTEFQRECRNTSIMFGKGLRGAGICGSGLFFSGGAARRFRRAPPRC